jgi:hypothetical protein
MNRLKTKSIRNVFFAVLVLLSNVSKSQNTFPASGNVGIGTSNPSSHLTVAAGSSTTVSVEGSGGGGNQSILQFAPWSGRPGGAPVKLVTIDDDWAAHFAIYTAAPGDPVNTGYNSAVERMRVTTRGYLGINNSNPQTRMHLTGNHSEAQFRLTLPASENGSGNGDISLQTWVSEPMVTWDAGGIGMNVTNDGSNDGGAYGFGRLNGNIGQSFIRFIPNGGAMQFNTTANNGTHYANTIYMADGSVGIGTNNTGTMKLAVEGTIGARKVVVTQTTPWPDYVFHSNYRLRSLSGVEKYINKNKHLPDVPSAAEIEKSGVDLAATQAVLLRKIEELTLYVIEQGKLLNNQNKKITLLQREAKKPGKAS